MLRIFPFSLRDKALHWFDTLPENSIDTWAELQKQFLVRYYPVAKTIEVRQEITHFVQLDDETFHESCDRFNELQRT